MAGEDDLELAISLVIAPNNPEMAAAFAGLLRDLDARGRTEGDRLGKGVTDGLTAGMKKGQKNALKVMRDFEDSVLAIVKSGIRQQEAAVASVEARKARTHVASWKKRIAIVNAGIAEEAQAKKHADRTSEQDQKATDRRALLNHDHALKSGRRIANKSLWEGLAAQKRADKDYGQVRRHADSVDLQQRRVHGAKTVQTVRAADAQILQEQRQHDRLEYVTEQASQARRTALAKALFRGLNNTYQTGLSGITATLRSHLARRNSLEKSEQSKSLEITRSGMRQKEIATNLGLDRQNAVYSRGARNELRTIQRTQDSELRIIKAGAVRQADAVARAQRTATTGVLGAVSGRSRIGGVIAGGVAAAGGTMFIRDAIKAASDLNESQTKFAVVFRQLPAASLASLKEWAHGASETLGISNQAALESTATFGNLFTALQIPPGITANMSRTLVGLASDLASFNNANPQDVIEALRSGIVGETEPLRKFGISLSQVRIESEAVRLGLTKSIVDPNKIEAANLAIEKGRRAQLKAIKEHGKGSLEERDATNAVEAAQARLGKTMQGAKVSLTASQKAQATYSLIMKDSALAQGDFARTSSGLANKQRIATARFADLKAMIGGFILPLYLNLTIAVSDLIRNLAKGEGMWGIVRAGLLGIAAALGAMLAVKAATQIFSLIGAGLSIIAANPLIAIFVGLSAIGGILLRIAGASKPITDFWRDLTDVIGKFVEGSRNWIIVGYLIAKPIRGLSNLTLMLTSIGATARLFVSSIGKIREALVDLFTGKWSKGMAILNSVWDKLFESLRPAGRVIKDALSNAFQAAREFVTSFFSTMFSDGSDIIASKAGVVGATIALRVRSLLATVFGTVLPTAIGLVREFFVGLFRSKGGGESDHPAALAMGERIRGVVGAAIQNLASPLVGTISAAIVGLLVAGPFGAAVGAGLGLAITNGLKKIGGFSGVGDLLGALFTGGGSESGDASAGTAMGERIRKIVGSGFKKAKEFIGNFVGDVILPGLVELPRTLGRFLSRTVFSEQFLKGLQAIVGVVAGVAVVIAVQFMRGFAEGIFQRRKEIAGVISDLLGLIVKTILGSGNPFLVLGGLLAGAFVGAKIIGAIAGVVKQVQALKSNAIVAGRALRGDFEGATDEAKRFKTALREAKRERKDLTGKGFGADLGNQAKRIRETYNSIGKSIGKAIDGAAIGVFNATGIIERTTKRTASAVVSVTSGAVRSVESLGRRLQSHGADMSFLGSIDPTALRSRFQRAYGGALSAVGTQFANFGTNIGKVTTAIADRTSFVWAAVKSKASSAFSAVQGAWTKATAVMGTAIDRFKDKFVKTKLTGSMTGSEWVQAVNRNATVAENRMRVMQGVAGAVATGMSGYFAGASNDMTSKVTGAVGVITGSMVAFAADPVFGAIALAAGVIGFVFGQQAAKVKAAKAKIKSETDALALVVDTLVQRFKTAFDEFSPESVGGKVSATFSVIRQSIADNDKGADDFFKRFGVGFSDVAIHAGQGRVALKRYLDTMKADKIQDILHGDAGSVRAFGALVKATGNDLADFIKGAGIGDLDIKPDQLDGFRSFIADLRAGKVDVDTLKDRLIGFGATAKFAADTTARYARLISQGVDATAGARFAGSLPPALQKAIEQYQTLKDLQRREDAEIDQARAPADRYSEAWGRVKDGIDKSRDAYRTWLDVQNGGKVSAAQANLDLLGAAQDFAKLGDTWKNQQEKIVLLGRAQSTWGDLVAQTAADSNGSMETFQKKIVGVRQGLIEQLIPSFNGSREAAQAFVDKFALIPDEAHTKILLDNKDAVTNFDQLNTKLQDYITSHPEIEAKLKTGDALTKQSALNDALRGLADSDYTAKTYLETGSNWEETKKKVKEDLDAVRQPIQVAVTLYLSNLAEIRDQLRIFDRGVEGQESLISHRAAQGGVFSYARGGVTPAHIAKRTVFKYAEPETGGEAFIPRRGSRERARKFLTTAASWYNMAVVPMAAGGVLTNEEFYRRMMELSRARAAPSDVVNYYQRGLWMTTHAGVGDQAFVGDMGQNLFEYVQQPGETYRRSDSFASNDANDPHRGQPGYVQAEDGSWVPTSFYSKRPKPNPLAGWKPQEDEAGWNWRTMGNHRAGSQVASVFPNGWIGDFNQDGFLSKDEWAQWERFKTWVRSHARLGFKGFAGGGRSQRVPRNTIFQYGEPQTGGEAYVPRYGNSMQAKKILDTAAAWHNMAVVPMAGGGVTSKPPSFSTSSAFRGGSPTVVPTAGTGDIATQISHLTTAISTGRDAPMIGSLTLVESVSPRQSALDMVQAAKAARFLHGMNR